MRYVAAVVLGLACSFLGQSQTYEIGGFLGGSNYIGDVGRTNFIAPNNLAFGAIFKWNRSARHSFRGSLIFSEITANDLDSNEKRRQQRGYSFNNNIFEASVGIEYTFWEFNLYSGYPQTTPYLYTGLTYFTYKSLYKPGEVITDFDAAGSVAIPMVVGIKSSIAGRFVLGIEIGARYTFTDNLDGSNPNGTLADEESLKFGNINSDDWYVFTGVTLTVMFGRQPCYCNF